MDRKLVMALIFVILGLATLTSGCTQNDQNTTQNNTIQNATQNNTVPNATQNSTVQNNTNVSGRGYVTAAQSKPNTPQKRGTYATIPYTVTNNGKNTVYNVKAWSQVFDKNIGTLGPGQTKKYTYQLYIPTDKDLASQYDSNVKLPNPYDIGGFYVDFTDAKGVSHRVQSNLIAIKWK